MFIRSAGLVSGDPIQNHSRLNIRKTIFESVYINTYNKVQITPTFHENIQNCTTQLILGKDIIDSNEAVPQIGSTSVYITILPDVF